MLAVTLQLMFVALLFLLVSGNGFSENVFHKIKVAEGSACYRIFNGTHQFGCHANSDKSNGVVKEIIKEDDLRDVKSCWRSHFEDYTGSYWLLIPIYLLQNDVIHTLRESNCISGLIIYEDETYLKIYDKNLAASHDSPCPNEANNYYSKDEGYCTRKINEPGAVTMEGLRNIDWPFQIVYLKNRTETDVIRKCHDLFNLPKIGEEIVRYPFCGMSFSLFNSAAGSSTICHRRSLESAKLFQLNIDSSQPPLMCSPLVGHNLFAWPTPVTTSEKLEKKQKFMLIASRMDSFGLIPEVSPGEISVMTSLISVIAVAKSIGDNRKAFDEAAKRTSKRIMMAVFNGESFDYIGSSAAVHRMRNGVFPLPELNVVRLQTIELEQIEVVLEAQQISSNSAKKLFAHTDEKRHSTDRRFLDPILDAMRKGVEEMGTTLQLPGAQSRIPPASWHSFGRFNDKVQGIVLAPFNEKYEYRRYNSMLDKNTWSDSEKKKAIDDIQTAAVGVLKGAASYVGIDGKKTKLDVDRQLVSTLFDCLVTSKDWFECEFLRKLNGGRINKTEGTYAEAEKSTYVSVSNSNPIREIVHWLFVYALGTHKETENVKDRNSCTHLSENQAVYSYDWQPDPYTGNFSCMRSSIQFIQEMSPAFEIDDYDLSKNSTYSTWTESVYTIDSIRLFLIEEETFDWTLLVIGVLVALLSIFAVGRCNESTFIVDEGEPQAEGGEPL